MPWIHVLNQHKRHPCIRWQRFQQKCECFQTSSRSSDSDDRKDRGLGALCPSAISDHGFSVNDRFGPALRIRKGICV